MRRNDLFDIDIDTHGEPIGDEAKERLSYMVALAIEAGAELKGAKLDAEEECVIAQLCLFNFLAIYNGCDRDVLTEASLSEAAGTATVH